VESGEILHGRFRILEPVDEGGMGTVYRAEDLQNGGTAAIKLVRLRRASDRERFVREISVLAELSHPGIVRYITHGKGPSDTDFLAMEWVSGETLAHRLEHRGMNIRETVATGHSAALALAAIHQAQIVHRDIKPRNLIFPNGAGWSVKIIDLGIARHVGQTTGPTNTGVMVGSPGYMSPEQARGSREIEPPSDVFSLGCVLFECLTGRPAFLGPDVMAIRAKVLLADPPRVAELNTKASPRLNALVMSMLAKDPVQRPQNGLAVAAALANLKESGGPRVKRRAVPEDTAATVVIQRGQPGNRTLVERDPSHEPSDPDFLLLVGSPEDPNLPGKGVDGVAEQKRHQAVSAIVSSEAGRLESMESGWQVAIFHRRGSDGADPTSRAVRCALAIKAVVPDAPVALVGRTVRLPRIQEMIDHGVEILLRESMHSLFSPVMDEPPVVGVRIDDALISRVEHGYQLHHCNGATYLVAERKSAGETDHR
jgi:serine/threonine protein kinase